MKSITIHKLDQDLYTALQGVAQEEGLSLNKLVKKILRRSLGLEPVPKKKIDFSDIAGSWTPEEANSFEEAMSDFSEIEKSEW